MSLVSRVDKLVKAPGNWFRGWYKTNVLNSKKGKNRAEVAYWSLAETVTVLDQFAEDVAEGHGADFGTFVNGGTVTLGALLFIEKLADAVEGDVKADKGVSSVKYKFAYGVSESVSLAQYAYSRFSYISTGIMFVTPLIAPFLGEGAYPVVYATFEIMEFFYNRNFGISFIHGYVADFMAKKEPNARSGTARKKTAKKTSSRKSSSRKSTSRKSTARKSSSRTSTEKKPGRGIKVILPKFGRKAKEEESSSQTGTYSRVSRNAAASSGKYSDTQLNRLVNTAYNNGINFYESGDIDRGTAISSRYLTRQITNNARALQVAKGLLEQKIEDSLGSQDPTYHPVGSDRNRQSQTEAGYSKLVDEAHRTFIRQYRNDKKELKNQMMTYIAQDIDDNTVLLEIEKLVNQKIIGPSGGRKRRR